MLKKPIIGDRVLLSFGLCVPEQKVPYKIFCEFVLVYV